MLKVLDSEKQSRRWVEEKIKSYNPETEYAEIVSLMAQYQLDEFTLNFFGHHTDKLYAQAGPYG